MPPGLYTERIIRRFSTDYPRILSVYSPGPEPEGEGEDSLDEDWEDVEGVGVDNGHHHHAQEAHHLQHVPAGPIEMYLCEGLCHMDIPISDSNAFFPKSA